MMTRSEIEKAFNKFAEYLIYDREAAPIEQIVKDYIARDPDLQGYLSPPDDQSIIKETEGSFIKDAGHYIISFDKGANLGITILTKDGPRTAQISDEERSRLANWLGDHL